MYGLKPVPFTETRLSAACSSGGGMASIIRPSGRKAIRSSNCSPGREATIKGATKGISAARCQRLSPAKASAPMRQNRTPSGGS